MIVWPVEKKIGPIQKTLKHVSHYLLEGSFSCKRRKIQDPHPWCAPCAFCVKLCQSVLKYAKVS